MKQHEKRHESALGSLSRLAKKLDWLTDPLSLHFEERKVNVLDIKEEFEKMNGHWVKGNLEMKTLLKSHEEPHLYVCRIDGYAEIMHHYHPAINEIIDVLEGELVVETYHLDTKKLISKVTLNKTDGKYVVPANIGHYAYSHYGALYVVGFEHPNPNREFEVDSIDKEIKHLLDTTQSDSIYRIETVVKDSKPIIIGASDNIERLGIKKSEFIGMNAFDFVDVDNQEEFMSDILTKQASAKTAKVKLPTGEVTVIGFLYNLGNGRINEYLIKL